VYEIAHPGGQLLRRAQQAAIRYTPSTLMDPDEIEC
jgi:hypothetical protein